MPITEELKNVRKFESVGFSHEQSETLAEVVEQAQSSAHQDLKEFIRDLLNNKIDNLRLELKTDIAESSKDLLIKLFGIIVGTVGVAVTILKLFP